MRYRLGCVFSVLMAVRCSPPIEAPDAAPDSATPRDSATARDSEPESSVDSATVADVAMHDTSAGDDAAMDAIAEDAARADAAVEAGSDASVADAPSCAPGLVACGAAGCVDTQRDDGHCGACNSACPAGRVCVAGSCACPAGQTLCGGACVDTQSSNSHCGACGNGCAALAFCVAGSCQSTCTAPRSVCAAGGSSVCVDTTNDLAHCGACNSACARANATASCVAGACGIASCNAGFSNCDGNASNGCETNTNTSVSHCGACGRACAAPANATASCVAGVCGIASCNAGFSNCDGNASNGCETNTNTSALNCGACGNACSLPNATAACSSGTCGVLSCNLGFANCDANAANGCEIDTRNNVNHCGTCGTACPVDPNGTTTCSGGACNLVCNAGYYRDGSACSQTPRLLAPLSAGDVSMRTPRLRWAPIAGFADAEVELCTTRACTTVLQRLDVLGATTTVVSTALPASSVVYWRVRGARGAARGAQWSPVWLFHTPAVSASTGVQSSYNPHTDVDADGFDDFVVGIPGGGIAAGGNVSVTRGTATGLSAGSSNLAGLQSAGDDFGYSVACAGDTDGDGVPDLVAGTPGEDFTGRTDAGFARLFRGANPEITITGALGGERLGASVAGLGDVNGDGYADMAVGAPSASPGGRAGAGTVSIFYGRPTGVSTTASVVLEGAAAGDDFGRIVAGLGDVNADGYSDIAVGAWGADVGGMSNVGQVSIYYGSAAGISTTPSRVLSGVGANARFGFSVRSAGDVNNDGYTDVLIGAPGEANGATAGAGAAHLFLGTAAGIGATAHAVSRGTTADENYGYTAATAGDVNNDGFDDVLVGAPGADPMGRTNAGSAFLFNGQASGVDFSTAARRFDGATAHYGIARWVTAVGDINRDGFADYAIGSSTVSNPMQINTGATTLVFGPTAAPALPLQYSEGVGTNARRGHWIASRATRTRASARASCRR